MASTDPAPTPRAEPDTPAAIRAWVVSSLAGRDPFGHLRAATDEHRRDHACNAYPTGDGPLLGVLARTVGAQRVLELGSGLGYSALWLAHGAAPEAVVETVDDDPAHVELARRYIAEAGYSDRIRVVHGDAGTVVDEPGEPVDVLFFDAYAPTPALLDRFAAAVRPGGLLVTANLFLAQHDPQPPGLQDAATYRIALLDDERWLTGFAGEKAVSVRR